VIYFVLSIDPVVPGIDTTKNVVKFLRSLPKLKEEGNLREGRKLAMLVLDADGKGPRSMVGVLAQRVRQDGVLCLKAR